MVQDREYFEKLYRRLNRKQYIHPDPLEFVSKYHKVWDREIVAFIAASLAYGNVTQILKSVEKVLTPMGTKPRKWLFDRSPEQIGFTYQDFKHRFTTGAELAVFLVNIKRALQKHGSLERMFSAHYRTSYDTIEPALYAFVKEFSVVKRTPTLIPDADKKSSFKRFNLFLRWMIRKDTVDPGVWKNIPASKLIVPLDTHMFQKAKQLGLTKRKDTSMKTALEITAAFRAIYPKDPVRYDFCLTREGIRRNL